MIKTRRRFAFSLGLLLAALLPGCGGDIVLPEEGEAADLQIVSGNGQIAPVGTTLPQQVVVRVLDTRERPVPNQDVTFTIGSGGGTVEPATVKSNAAGDAAASWTLGPSSGSHMLRVQTPRGGSGTLEVTVGATAIAGSGSVLAEAGGNGQSGPVNSALADSLVVKATDALGNPVAGVEVSWSVSGGGSISPLTVVTGADGLAAAERVLGPAAGEQSAQATVDEFTGSPVTFNHTAVPANPTALVKISGDGQTAPGGFEVAQDLVVRLEDDDGNGIGGAPITWTVDAGSGSVNPGNTTTDANGLAATRWTLPTTVGTHSLSAVFSGLDAVRFTATATADVPTTIELVSGNNQSAVVGGTLPNPLVVRVTDANDNPVANVGVAWAASDGGSVSEANTATDASGLAQVTRTLGAVPGAYATTATVGGLSGSPVTFTSTATVGPAAKLAIITQPGTTTATSGIALVPQPEIEVQDALGNPILQAGRTVSASITSSPEDPLGPGSATLAGANDQTNSTGRTTYTGLRITGPSGPYELTFSSGALIPVSSATITLGAGSATRLVMQQQPSGSAQSGVVFARQPSVRVEDAAGNPVTGSRNIQVTIGSGAGTLSGTTTVSTGGGSTAAFTDLEITGVVGDRTLLFSSAGLTSAESDPITITAGPASSMTPEAGHTPAQSASVNTAVAIDPAVIVTDAAGNPVAGAAVAFEVTGGGGTVDPAAPATVTTGADGIATVTSWTMGPTAGTNTMTATAGALGPVTFTATGTSGPATRLVITQQPPTTAASGAVLVPAPIVRVEDAAGNPVAGNRDILVDIESGPGELSGTTQVNTSGGATATFNNLRITGTAGAHTLLFSSAGLTSAESDPITITAGPASSMTPEAGHTPAQSASVNTAVAIDPAVIVTDAAGNPVAGAAVAFEVTGGGGTVDPAAPATVTTGADGIATVTSWTMGPTAGTNTMTATAEAFGPVTFTAEATS